MHPQVEASEFSEHMEPVSTGLATLIKTTKARALETIYQVTRVHLLRARMCVGGAIEVTFCVWLRYTC